MAAQGAPNVRVRTETVRGKKRPVVIITIAKHRQWRYFNSVKAANAEAAKIRKEIEDAGAAWVAMTADERAEIIGILREVKREKLSLRKVWTDYQELSRNQPGRTKALGVAADLFLEDMKRAGCAHRYIGSLDQYLRLFNSGREQLGCDKIGKQEIDDWFDLRKEGGSTRNSNLGRLSSFFDFCYRSGWIRSNPVLLVTKLKVETKPPRILTPEQFKRVLFICYWKFNDFFPYLVLALICGIRPEEIEELTWADIDLKHRAIDVNKTSAADKRVIPLDDTMEFCLNLCRRGKLDEKVALSTLRVLDPGRKSG